MSDSKISRRSFVQTGLMSLLAGRAALPSAFALKLASVKEVEVMLEGRTADPGRELVNFGLPLRPRSLGPTECSSS